MRTELQRALSKLGFCSRAKAAQLVLAGRVRVNDRVCREPLSPVDIDHDQLDVDGVRVGVAAKMYLMLHKPRGVVTTTADEKGRQTVYACLPSTLPFVAPVGRLDKASEGLLLFTNDSTWAARITEPATHLDKTYHVQIARAADEKLGQQLEAGVRIDDELTRAKKVSLLRHGAKNAWLEIVLDEGKNRQIRRLLGALDIEVLRLVRVAIGSLPLGALRKGEHRALTAAEVAALSG